MTRSGAAGSAVSRGAMQAASRNSAAIAAVRTRRRRGANCASRFSSGPIGTSSTSSARNTALHTLGKYASTPEQAIAASTQRKTAARLGGPRRFFGEVFCGCSIADTFSAFTALVNRG